VIIYRLDYFDNNFTNDEPRVVALCRRKCAINSVSDPKIIDLLQMKHL